MHGGTRARRRISPRNLGNSQDVKRTSCAAANYTTNYAAPRPFPRLTVWLELVKHANDSLILLLMDVL